MVISPHSICWKMCLFFSMSDRNSTVVKKLHRDPRCSGDHTEVYTSIRISMAFLLLNEQRKLKKKKQQQKNKTNTPLLTYSSPPTPSLRKIHVSRDCDFHESTCSLSEALLRISVSLCISCGRLIRFFRPHSWSLFLLSGTRERCRFYFCS